MKIAIWHNLPSGGGKRALYDHVKGLVGRGHMVEAWCPPTADRSYLPLTEFCEEHVVPLFDAEPWKAMRRGRALLEYKNMARRLSAMDDHCRECASQINRRDFDVLFANSCVSFRVTPIGKYVRVPALIYLQEAYRWLYEALPSSVWASPSSVRSRWSLTRVQKTLVDAVKTQANRLQVRHEIDNAAAFNAILVNSLFSRESIVKAYGLESQVCYLGVDIERFTPKPANKTPYIIGLGGLSYAKGADRGIRAVGHVDRAKRPELVWVANFSDRRCERETLELASNYDVRFTLKVGISDDEVIELLSSASMLLYTPRLEPFGLAPLEANACGTPVVAIAEGGVRESIEHEQNGLLVNGDNPQKLAMAIERILDDPVFAQELCKRSLRYVHEKWQMSGAIDRLEEALFDLAGKGSPNRRSVPDRAQAMCVTS